LPVAVVVVVVGQIYYVIAAPVDDYTPVTYALNATDSVVVVAAVEHQRRQKLQAKKAAARSPS
jgi:anti-sigma-K factor RskA